MTNSPSQSPTDNYRVVVFGEPEDLTIVQESLSENAGLHRDDAMTSARLAPGVLPGHFAADVAQAVAAQIVRGGINALALPEADIPKLDHAEVIHHACCEDDGLMIFDLHGGLERGVPWRDLSLLSVGSVPMKAGHRLSAESAVVLHAAPNPHVSIVEPLQQSAIVLWLVCDRPWKPYRLVHNQMNYAYLGGRKPASATQNFAMFAEDLSRHAPQAYLTPATRAYLHHGLRRHYEFHSADELRSYTILHLLLMRQICTGAAGIPA